MNTLKKADFIRRIEDSGAALRRPSNYSKT